MVDDDAPVVIEENDDVEEPEENDDEVVEVPDDEPEAPVVIPDDDDLSEPVIEIHAAEVEEEEEFHDTPEPVQEQPEQPVTQQRPPALNVPPQINTSGFGAVAARSQASLAVPSTPSKF